MIEQLLIQAEREVLGFLLYSTDKGKKFELIETLEPSDFVDQTNRVMYEKAVKVFVVNGDVDVVTLAIDAPSLAVAITDIPNKDYWNDARYKIHELRGRAKLRRLDGIVTSIKLSINDKPIGEQIKSIEDFIFNEYRSERSKVNIENTVNDLLEKAANLEEGSSVGFDWLKEVPTLRTSTGGIERGKLYVVGATKKSGKTRFAIAVMKRLIEQGEMPLFLSMEMREIEVSKLLLSAFSGISTSVFTRRLSPFELHGLQSKKDLFLNKIVIDVDSRLSIEQVRAKIWRASSRGCSVVFIDFLQRMDFPESRSKNFAGIISDTVARIADMSRDYNVATILLSQLRNEAEDEKIADMRYLKDSGGIAENADAILILNNKQRQATGEDKYPTETTSHSPIDLWISLEQRSGATRLIKTSARLGRMEFLEQTDRIVL